jgi:hypothetical protein
MKSPMNFTNILKIKKYLNEFRFETSFENLFIDFYIISKTSNDENIIKLANLIKKSIEESEFNPDIERGIGRLLGYQEVDIEYFINQTIKCRVNKK